MSRVFVEIVTPKVTLLKRFQVARCVTSAAAAMLRARAIVASQKIAIIEHEETDSNVLSPNWATTLDLNLAYSSILR